MPNTPSPKPNEPGKNNHPIITGLTMFAAAIAWTAFNIADRDYAAFTNYVHMQSLDGWWGVGTLVLNGMIWGLIPGLFAAGIVTLISYGGPFAGKFIGKVSTKVTFAARTARMRSGQARPNDPPPPTLPQPLTLAEAINVLAVTVSFWAIWYGLQTFVHFATYTKMHGLTDWPHALEVTFNGVLWSWPRGILAFAMAIFARWIPPAALAWLGPILDVIVVGQRAATRVVQRARRAIRGDGPEVRIDDPKVKAYLQECPKHLQSAVIETAMLAYMLTHQTVPHTENEARRD